MIWWILFLTLLFVFSTDQPLPTAQITIVQHVENEFVDIEVKSVLIHSEYYSYLYRHDLAILESEESLLLVKQVDEEGNIGVQAPKAANLAGEEIYKNSNPEEVFNKGCWSVGWFFIPGSMKMVTITIRFIVVHKINQ